MTARSKSTATADVHAAIDRLEAAVAESRRIQWSGTRAEVDAAHIAEGEARWAAVKAIRTTPPGQGSGPGVPHRGKLYIAVKVGQVFGLSREWRNEDTIVVIPNSSRRRREPAVTGRYGGGPALAGLSVRAGGALCSTHPYWSLLPEGYTHACPG
jgi:hypothetical protein